MSKKQTLLDELTIRCLFTHEKVSDAENQQLIDADMKSIARNTTSNIAPITSADSVWNLKDNNPNGGTYIDEVSLPPIAERLELFELLESGLSGWRDMVSPETALGRDLLRRAEIKAASIVPPNSLLRWYEAYMLPYSNKATVEHLASVMLANPAEYRLGLEDNQVEIIKTAIPADMWSKAEELAKELPKDPKLHSRYQEIDLEYHGDINIEEQVMGYVLCSNDSDDEASRYDWYYGPSYLSTLNVVSLQQRISDINPDWIKDKFPPLHLLRLKLALAAKYALYLEPIWLVDNYEILPNIAPEEAERVLASELCGDYPSRKWSEAPLLQQIANRRIPIKVLEGINLDLYIKVRAMVYIRTTPGLTTKRISAFIDVVDYYVNKEGLSLDQVLAGAEFSSDTETLLRACYLNRGVFKASEECPPSKELPPRIIVLNMSHLQKSPASLLNENAGYFISEIVISPECTPASRPILEVYRNLLNKRIEQMAANRD